MNTMNHLESWGPETARILTKGSYRAEDGTRVDIAAELRACCNATRLYEPDDLETLWQALVQHPDSGVPHITIENATTLAAAQRLRERHERVALLNFASARNPGGGFLGGARAQEESLARASGL